MLQSQTKNKEWHDTQFQSHMHFIPGGTVRLRLRAFQVFSPKKTKGIRERKTGQGGRWGGGKGKRNRIKKISIWTKCTRCTRLTGERGSVGWARSHRSRLRNHRAPASPSGTGSWHLAPKANGRQRAGKIWGPSEIPFVRHPQPSVPSARDSSGWAADLGVRCWWVFLVKANTWM